MPALIWLRPPGGFLYRLTRFERRPLDAVLCRRLPREHSHAVLDAQVFGENP